MKREPAISIRRARGIAADRVPASSQKTWHIDGVARRTGPLLPAQAPSAAERPRAGAGRRLFSDDAWNRLAERLRLSRRESEIVRAVFDDEKETSIAAELGISTHTVHSHLERMYRKLGVSSRLALVVRVFAEYLSNLGV